MICNLKSCWCWCVRILKCRPWERGLDIQTYLFEWLCPKATCIELTCRKSSERFFWWKVSISFIWGACFPWDAPTFCEKAEKFEKRLSRVFYCYKRVQIDFIFFVLKFLNTILKFSAKEAMSGTSSHLYSNGYFCVFQEARNTNQMILVLKKEHTLSQCTSFRGNYHLSLLQKVLQW